MRRPPRPHDDDRDDVDEHRDNDNGDDDVEHCGALEKKSEESNGADCYLAPFNNTTIRYVVAAMV